MFIKKNIVLLGVNDEDQKGVLSLERKEDVIFGRVRLYNFSVEPQGIISIGFYNDGQVVKAGLSKKSSMTFEFKVDGDDLGDSFSCAVVNITGGEVKPLLFGNSEGRDSSKLADLITEIFDGELKVDAVTDLLDKNEVDYDQQMKAEVERVIDENMPHDCATCRYKKCFYENNEKVSEVKNTFFDEIKGQVDNLFEENEKEDFLESIIPNSKWVKVEYEESGDYYILGLIYENDELKYICYGVPGVYQKTPPKELSGYPVWLPLDNNHKESFGYWISYQDAENGEPVRAIVEG